MHLREFVVGALGVATPAALACAAMISTVVPATVQQEALISGSVVSGGTFATRIAWGSTGETQGIFEFALPALPAGATNPTATLHYDIAETTFGGGIASQLRFFPYAGNGRFDNNDANHYNGPNALSVPHFSTGPFTLDINAQVAAVRSSNARWLGLNTWQEISGFSTGVARGSAGMPAPRVVYTAQVPDVGSITATPLFDVRAEKSGASFILYDGDGELAINTQAYGSIDRRGLMEFHLGGIPEGAAITSATLTLRTRSMTMDVITGGPTPIIGGYVGDGLPSPDDASQPPLFLASQKVDELGPTTFTLDPFAVQALLRSGGVLGITVLGSTDGRQYGFETLEWGDSPPRLDIAYAVPEPSVFLTLGATTLAFLARRRPRFDSHKTRRRR